MFKLILKRNYILQQIRLIFLVISICIYSTPPSFMNYYLGLFRSGSYNYVLSYLYWPKMAVLLYYTFAPNQGYRDEPSSVEI